LTQLQIFFFDSALGEDPMMSPGWPLERRSRLFSIGEFSKITGLSIKAIHLYHEKGLLVPARIDTQTGYRYFNTRNAEQARAIRTLREMSFSLEEIKLVLTNFAEDDDLLLDAIKDKREVIQSQLAHLKGIAKILDAWIASEEEVHTMATNNTLSIEHKTLAPLLVVAKRWKGRYQDSGDAFAELGRKMGRFISGKPMNLYHDAEFKEQDADIQTCFALRNKPAKVPKELIVQELPGGTFVSLVHRGPYTELGKSYERLFNYLHENGLQATVPSREVYLKGPGMIFRGNPKNYLTEIQIPVA
jgi:DNA-binding transcriptional MerR regulator